ncbi:MAG: TonB-dependent receptor plug domain-containing protein [Paludibacteraceae bacterium]|nr:TonB-dependent receptor plug domain-containing protein [Paludibacteraceae bacterium]
MYKQKLSFFTLPCLFCVLFCTLNLSVIYAKDKPVLDTSYVYTIAEIEIVRTQRKQEILPAQTLQGDMLSKLSSHSVADAVRYFSGVQLKDYGGIGGLKTINIRSMGTNHMGVFYNGIQLGNAQNGQVDLGRFSLDNMESISLYNGQKSTVLQSAKDFGAAGSIYLQTKTPTFEPNKTYNLIGNYKTGSFGLHNPSLVWQQKITSTISSVVSAEYTNAHGRYPFTFRKVSADGTVAYDTTAIRKNADIEAIRTEFGLFGKTSNTDWHVQVYNYHSERGLPGYIARNIYEHQQRLWDNNFFVQSSIKYSKNKYSLLGNIKYADDYTRYLNPD